MVTTLILPGLENSGPEHWQTIWEKNNSSFHRVVQNNWDSPHCTEWVQRLNDVIHFYSEKLVLVAHSSACALVAHWSCQANATEIKKIQGALLVAPSDPEGPNYPIGPIGFGPVPLNVLPFPSIVVASTDDQYITVDKAKSYASAWHSRLVVLENAGHINSSSGLGNWPQGLELLNELKSLAS